MKLLSTTKKQLATLELMVECAYLNGFHFDENLGPRRCALDFVQELRESIEQEMIMARARGYINVPEPEASDSTYDDFGVNTKNSFNTP